MTNDRQDDERVDTAWHERTGGQGAEKPQRTFGLSVVVEMNRSRSDLVNLKVAAVEDKRVARGRNLTVHFAVGINIGRQAQIFAPDVVCINSGFAAVRHLVENPVAYGAAFRPGT